MIDLSIVTGTFNRLPHLQRFVGSVRATILPELSYEIILVDGGSTDGTQQWCKVQSDVRLIEHGSLKGAVKAFNDGFAIAEGKYCIAGNDDVEFQDRSLAVAWIFMEAHPEVGQGCFYQKRGKQQTWHVEEMMAAKGDKRISVPYGQIAIVPSWLGEKVGWWGNVTRTYGGDNELSANIWEAGYKVVPIPNARIMDQMVDDNLRELNQGDPMEMARRGEQHPDTSAWYQKWPRGPKVGDGPQWGLRPIGELRILYCPIIENQFPAVVEQKHGLGNALGMLGRTVEYNYQLKAQELGDVKMRAELYDLAALWQPDVILLQIHAPKLITKDLVYALRYAAPGAQIVNWNGDYNPNHLNGSGGLDFAEAVDVQCLVNASELAAYHAAGISAAYWQIGFEPEGVGYEPNGQTPQHDILLLANRYTKERLELGQALQASGHDVGIYGMGWPDGMASGENLYDFREGCRLLRAAKVAVGDQQWADQKGYVSNRLFQTLAAGGAVYLQQEFAGMGECLGLKEYTHLLIWNSFSELRERIDWALANPTEARMIAEAGQEYVLEHHSFDARVRELRDMVLDRRML